jgi:hypothetical protein
VLVLMEAHERFEKVVQVFLFFIVFSFVRLVISNIMLDPPRRWLRFWLGGK